MFRYREYSPNPLLRPYVRLIWNLECSSLEDFGKPMRIAPDGIVEAVFHYRAPINLRFSGESFEAQPTGSLVSQTQRFIEIAPNGPTGFISVRFRPGGVYHFLRLPVSEIANRMIATDAIWGASGRELQQRFVEAPNTTERIRLVENFLIGKLRKYQKADVAPLAQAVWRRKGQIRVVELVDEFGLGERRLERIFSNAFGMPPQGFARVARFLNSCALLRQNNRLTLTDVATATGYYDQSHFISDFRALAGMTPGQFAKSQDLSFLELD